MPAQQLGGHNMHVARLIDAAATRGPAWPPQWMGRNKETRGSALDSIYSIMYRTARKADELTGAHSCPSGPAWLPV